MFIERLRRDGLGLLDVSKPVGGIGLTGKHGLQQPLGRIGALVEILPHSRTSKYLLSEVVRRASLGNFHLDGRVIYGRIDHLESE